MIHNDGILKTKDFMHLSRPTDLF